MKIVRLQIGGLKCIGCADRAQTALQRLEGVLKVITSIDEQMAEVTFDEERLRIEDLHTTIRTAGFSMLQDAER